jgi:hypothetical protein
MTWFANHIYAAYKPTLLSALKEHPILGKGLYLITDISDFTWYRPEHEHGLPAGGLIVVRELCFPGVDSDAAEWHGRDALVWASTSSESCAVIPPQIVLSGTNGEHQEDLVPITFLRSLKAISVANESKFTYYAHFMWGGDTEYEFAWIFGPEDRAVKFLNYEMVLEVRIDKPPEHRPGTVLKTVMAELGVSLPTSVFAPHTRQFDWSRYRI